MARLSFGSLGWAYIGLCIAWTVLLICGMVVLFIHRELPCIRIRRLPLLFVGIIALHIYGWMCLLGNVIGPLVPCEAEFWIMSLYLPFGFAMFHAANSQFLHVASRQKQFARMSFLSDPEPLKQEEAEKLSNSRWRRKLRGLERADQIDRLMVYIGLGLVIELLLTLFIFFGSKKFHPAYGLWNWNVEGTIPEVRMACSKGWEWWLSIVWQFFWAWIYSPYMLWKSRGVNDVHGWRVQTICCCLAGLPASPLWLTGLYAPQMASVNAVFIPPSWFSLSIFVMEVVTIGFPILEIYQTHKLRQETMDAIAAWEKRVQVTSPSSSNFSEISNKSGKRSSKQYSIKEVHLSTDRKSLDSQRSDLYTMAGLENALRTNPVPLLQFAALRDFSGENISFLMHVAEWRRSWLQSRVSTAEHHRQQFISAVSVYAHFVTPDFSEFPINISCRNLKELRDVFEEAASRMFRRNSLTSNNSATPFDDPHLDSDSTAELSPKSNRGMNLQTLGKVNLDSVEHMARGGRPGALAEFPIPDAFKETVFDHAEKEIKYLVLTNTWPKFVNDACSSQKHDVEREAVHRDWFGKALLCSK